MIFKASKITFVDILVTDNKIAKISFCITDNSYTPLYELEKDLTNTNFNSIAKTVLNILNKSEVFVYFQTNMYVLIDALIDCGYNYSDFNFFTTPKFSLKYFWELAQPRTYENALKTFNVNSKNNIKDSVELTKQMVNKFGDNFDKPNVESIIFDDQQYTYIDNGKLLMQDLKTKSIYFAKGKYANRNFFEVLNNDRQYIDYMYDIAKENSTKKAIEYLINLTNG